MAPAVPVPEGQPRLSGHAANMAWAKSCGAKRYNPTFIDQVRVRRIKELPALFYAFDSWLEEHTSNWPVLSPYAISSDGTELHLGHAAVELGQDEENLRKIWNLGVRMKVWGNWPHESQRERDKYRGKRRMYRYGAVDLQQAEQAAREEEPADPYNPVCTYRFSDAIWLQIKDRPKEEIRGWIAEEVRAAAKLKAMHADLIAAWRRWSTQEEDNRWEARGVKPNRQEHEYKCAEKAAQASLRKDRVDELYYPRLNRVFKVAAARLTDAELPGLERELNRYVHTGSESVQSELASEYKPDGDGGTESPSLSGQRSTEQHRSLVSSDNEKRAGGAVANAALSRRAADREQHTGNRPESEKTGSKQLSPEEQAAVDLFFLKIRQYQESGRLGLKPGEQLLDPANKGDRALALSVLKLVTAAGMEGFVFTVGERIGARGGSMGKLWKTSILLEWAADYKRDTPRREELNRRMKEDNERRRQNLERLDRQAEQQRQHWNSTLDHWQTLTEEALQALRDDARADLHADPNTAKTMKWLTPEQRAKVIDERAQVRLCKQLFPTNGGAS